MDSRYIRQIMKPYSELGITYTDRYKSFGLEKAALIAEYSDIEKLLQCKIDLTQAVLIDIADLEFIKEFESLEKLCIVFTKRMKRTVDLKPIYERKLKTLLLSDDFGNVKQIDYAELPQLTCLKTNGRLFFNDRKYENLESLSLSNTIWDFRSLSYIPRLRSLTLDGGAVIDFGIANTGNKPEAIRCDNVRIESVAGLRNFVELRYLSIAGVFDPEITTELPFLKNLEYLKLDGNVEIADIDWVRYMPDLKTLIIGGSIKNGDLSLLKTIPFVRLKNDSPHYPARSRFT